MSAIKDGKLKMKLTIAADENPQLYWALLNIKDARRRTRRLKDLASKGSLVEQTSGALRGAEGVSPVAESTSMGGHKRIAGETVGRMLDWDGDQT